MGGMVNTDIGYSALRHLTLSVYKPWSKALQMLDLFQSLGVTNIRTALCPWWWHDLEHAFFTSPTRRGEYVSFLRTMLDACEGRGIKVIPVLMWRAEIWTDIDPEGRDLKKTFKGDLIGVGMERFEDYCMHVVGALKDHPAIDGWEITNEIDLNNPAIVSMSRREWRSWLGQHFFPRAYKAVRGWDSRHDITTGNANYDVQDAAEWRSCEPGELMSLHYYRPLGITTEKDLAWFANNASSLGRELYCGEIGHPFDERKSGYFSTTGFVNTQDRLRLVKEKKIRLAYWWWCSIQGHMQAYWNLVKPGPMGMGLVGSSSLEEIVHEPAAPIVTDPSELQALEGVVVAALHEAYARGFKKGRE